MFNSKSVSESSAELKEILELSCMYLAVADGEFSESEQYWVDAMFGQGVADKFIGDCLNIQWDHVFARINDLIGQLSDHEQQLLSDGIEFFLLNLLSVDGLEPCEEERLSDYLNYLGQVGLPKPSIQESAPIPPLAKPPIIPPADALPPIITPTVDSSQGAISTDWGRAGIVIPPRIPNEDSATKKQKNYIQKLLTDIPDLSWIDAEKDTAGLGKWQASSVIDQLKDKSLAFEMGEDTVSWVNQQSKEVNFELSDRDPDEPDATPNQIQFIKKKITAEDSELQKLGKWQASELIEQIEEESEMFVEEKVEEFNKKSVVGFLELATIKVIKVSVLTIDNSFGKGCGHFIGLA